MKRTASSAVRRDCKYLITIGACATSGGIQALRNWANIDEFAGYVYPSPQLVSTLETATPIAAHVFVDFELRGCPVNQYQLLEVISALLAGRKPNIPTHSLCIECKRRGVPCVLVSGAQPRSGTDHANRLRRVVSGRRPRLLRLFRPDGAAEHCLAGQLVHRAVGLQPAQNETDAPPFQRIPGTLQTSERSL